MPIVLSTYNSFSKFQANHTLKITSSQPKLESQAGNSPHCNSIGGGRFSSGTA